MKNHALKFALGTLAVSIIWILFEHLMGYNTTRNDIGQYTRMFPVIFFWIMLVVAIYYERRRHGNSLSFSEGFRTGLMMTLIFAAGFTLAIIMYSKFLNPDFYTTMKDFTTEQFQNGKLNNEQYKNAMEEVDRRYSGTPMSYLSLFGFIAIFGIGITALATLIMRRKPA